MAGLLTRNTQHTANKEPLWKPERLGWSIPLGIRPSAIPVHLVCGPPAAGKTTYVRTHAHPSDTIIDLDTIRIQVGGKPWDQHEYIKTKSFFIRNRMIIDLAYAQSGEAWLIVMAPTCAERTAWLTALGPECREILLPLPAAECKRRIEADLNRQTFKQIQLDAVDLWWAEYDGAWPA